MDDFICINPCLIESFIGLLVDGLSLVIKNRGNPNMPYQTAASTNVALTGSAWLLSKPSHCPSVCIKANNAIIKQAKPPTYPKPHPQPLQRPSLAVGTKSGNMAL